MKPFRQKINTLIGVHVKAYLISIQYKQKQGTKYKKYFQINASNRSFTLLS